MKQDLSNSYTT